jgi:hypothetical protein
MFEAVFGVFVSPPHDPNPYTATFPASRKTFGAPLSETKAIEMRGQGDWRFGLPDPPPGLLLAMLEVPVPGPPVEYLRHPICVR